MKGIFYTTKYIITVNDKEYEFKGEEIGYAAKRVPSDFVHSFTIDELKRTISDNKLQLQIYNTQYQGATMRTYIHQKSSKFFIDGIDITNTESIEIKFVFRQIKCRYTINELQDKLIAEDYINMMQTERLSL